MDEVARLRSFRATVADPPADVVAAAEALLLAQLEARAPANRLRFRRRRAFGVAVGVAACVMAAAGAFAAGLGDILDAPPAPRENQAALQNLFPPLQIGHAVTLAENNGRKLFGARTTRGGYCFSATSAIDPRGEGGYCVSRSEAEALDAGGEVVAFGMSGWSVGGYAPGASTVRVTGAGVDVTFPVQPNGWWVGAARVPVRPPSDVIEGYVVASSVASDGKVLGTDPLMHVTVVKGRDGRVIAVRMAML
jgi:hypothetical protein